MRTVLLIIAALIIGALIGFYYGSFGGKIKDGMQARYGNDIDRSEIIATLNNQASAWNNGDIDSFMQDYWKSEGLRYASGGTVNKSLDTTIARNKSRYPDKSAMGELAFTELDVEVLSESHALVFGRWRLTRENDSPNGLFTLHFKKFGKDWKIVSDHTSSAE